MTLSRLVRHPDKRIASKAALLLGRRVRNPLWVERHMSAEDARLRANVVEALWGTDSAFARQTLHGCLGDDSNRVVGNALVGLHLLGDPSVDSTVRRMLQDRRAPFRWTAAWVMGRIGSEAFRKPLEGALADPNHQVRGAARRALRAMTPHSAAGPPEGEGVPRGKEETKPAAEADQGPLPEVAAAGPAPGLDLHLDGHFVTAG